ncbi:hypothetical protein CRYUN_Cryun16bG0032900 [Craigia yunnanensis]
MKTLKLEMEQRTGKRYSAGKQGRKKSPFSSMKILSPDDPEGEGMMKKKEESSPRAVLRKKLHKSRLLKKAKKTIKRLEVEIAEKRGYTKCLKELVMEEATVMENGIQKMEAKLDLLKIKKEIAIAKNECMEQFIASMLSSWNNF